MSETEQNPKQVYPPNARQRPFLTKREAEIIKEEKRKGFFLNSLPLAAAFGYLYYWRLKKKNALGKSVGNDIFRIGLVSGLGFGIGRLFTFERAIKRIREEVPDGTAAKMARGEFKGPQSEDNVDKQDTQSTEQPVRTRQRPSYSRKPTETVPEEPSPQIVLPQEQPSVQKGLDDRFRPSVDSLETKSIKVDSDATSPPSKLRVRRNKYGDEIE